MKKLTFQFFKACFICVFLLHTQVGKAQSVHQEKNVSLHYGYSETLIPYEGEGIPSLDGNGNHIGLNYYREFQDQLGLNIGLTYSSFKLNADGINGSGIPYSHDYKSSYLNIPVTLEYTFLTYLFVNLGPTLSIQLDNDSPYNKSGIGLTGSIGGRLPLKNYFIQLAPFYHNQSLIPFNKDIYQSQQNIGICAGVGYRF